MTRRSMAGPTSRKRACSAARSTPSRGAGAASSPRATKKFEFYSETLKKGLQEHAKKYETTVDDILTVSGYVARGEVAFVPHYEPVKRHGSVADYPLTFIDYKSRLNREGRSQNLPWYQEFKKVDPGDVSWADVVKMNPVDGAKLGLKSGDTVKITSMTGTISLRTQALGGRAPGHRGQVLRPGSLGLRPRGRQRLCQSHSARWQQQ